MVGVPMAVKKSRLWRGGLDERLEQIERRLTDTQDVMIALSEKVDRLEEEGRPQAATASPEPSA